MNKLEEKILEIQKVDPLSVAEKLTGESYKSDKLTESLGFMLHIKRVMK